MFKPEDLIIKEVDTTTSTKDDIDHLSEDIIYDIEKSYYDALLEAHQNHLKNCMIILEDTRDMSLDSCIDILHESKLLQTKLKIRDYITDTMMKIIQKYHKHMNTKQDIQYLETAYHHFPSLRKTKGYYIPRDLFYVYPLPPIEDLEDTIFKDIDLKSHIAWKERLKKNTFLSNISSTILSNNKRIMATYIQKNSLLCMKKKQYYLRGDLLDKIKEWQSTTKTNIKTIYDYIQSLLIEINRIRNKIKEVKDDIKDIDRSLLSYNYNIFIKDMEYLTKCLGFYMKSISFVVVEDLELIKDLLVTMRDDMDEELKNTYYMPKFKRKPKLPAYYRTKFEDKYIYDYDPNLVQSTNNLDPIEVDQDINDSTNTSYKVPTPYKQVKKSKKKGV